MVQIAVVWPPGLVFFVEIQIDWFSQKKREIWCGGGSKNPILVDGIQIPLCPPGWRIHTFLPPPLPVPSPSRGRPKPSQNHQLPDPHHHHSCDVMIPIPSIPRDPAVLTSSYSARDAAGCVVRDHFADPDDAIDSPTTAAAAASG